jgi:hypothetical protein
MSEITVSNAIKEWDEGDHLMYDACHEAPEIAWQAILEILKRDLTDDEKAGLAAGPLEDVLALHGIAFIDRVEEEARRNPRFNHLLGGVWQNEMPLEIWERVQKARKEVW